MSLIKNKHLSKGWIRNDVGFNVVYLKAFKKDVIGTIIKYGNSPHYSYMIKNKEGRIMGFGKEFTSKLAASMCDDLFKSLNTKEF